VPPVTHSFRNTVVRSPVAFLLDSIASFIFFDSVPEMARPPGQKSPCCPAPQSSNLASSRCSIYAMNWWASTEAKAPRTRQNNGSKFGPHGLGRAARIGQRAGHIGSPQNGSRWRPECPDLATPGVKIRDMTLKVPFDRITIEPDKMGGKPCIRGLRIPVENVLNIVASYPDRMELFENYPDLEEEDLRQALAFAAASMDDQIEVLDLLPDSPNVPAAS